MEFDSPEAAKEFPGLYMADSGKADDSLEYTDDGEKKKSKKEKKKDKDKGYSALAAESSQDEDEALDPKSPGKGMKIKAFSKLSGKKKDKDKKSEKSEKELKKAEKEAKEKRKSEEKERKSIEKELSSTPGPSSAPRPQVPFSGAHLMRNNSHNSKSASITPQSSIDSGTPVKRNILSESFKDTPSNPKDTPSKPPKEKSAGFNVFLNAPAPILSKLSRELSKDKPSKKEHKDKEKKHKEKDKEKEKSESKSSKKEKDHKEKDKKEKEKDHSHPSGMAKVKLKLMRSKNSLEDPTGDVPHITSHQFPEDPEALAKEIKKYEGLLEQAHTQLKSSKKISKKQEEQLWELQRTLTQLKRKLRSINALSCASAYHIHSHSSNSERDSMEHPVSPAHHPIFKKCDSIDGHSMAKKLANNSDVKSSTSPDPGASSIVKDKEPVVATVVPTAASIPQEVPIPKIPMPPSKHSFTRSDSTAMATSPPTITPPQQFVPVPVNEAQAAAARTNSSNGETVTPAALSPVNSGIHVPDSSNNFASPRPSIDTIVQVHRSSVEGELSDNEEPFQDDDTENDMEDLRDESSGRIRSVSNMDSQEDSKESIEAVLDDANKMIGSMHEELMFEGALDALEVVSGDVRLRSGDHLNDSVNRVQDESDVELFTNDLELDEEVTMLPNEEPCPDPFDMPVFDTTEYMAIENDALSLFNEQLKEDLQKEKNELEEAIQRIPPKFLNPEDESPEPSQNEDDISDLITVWTKLKSENVVLWDNVNRLRHALAACRVDEFRLQTRLNYMETKTAALSPVTTTTPLQTEG